MSELEHSDCAICLYWQFRIDEEKRRALVGDEDAYLKEQRARAELGAHLERTKHMEAVSDAQVR